MGRFLWVMSVGCVFALLALMTFLIAESDQLIATADRPATITLTPAPERVDQSARIVISVIGFKPSRDGIVQGVVKAQSGSQPEQELGRFSVHPQDVEFRAANLAEALRYGFPIPKELLSNRPLKLNVYLVPSRGQGKDASLQLGGAEIIAAPS